MRRTSTLSRPVERRQSLAPAHFVAANDDVVQSHAGTKSQHFAMAARNVQQISMAGRIWRLQRQPVATSDGDQIHRESGRTSSHADFRGRVHGDAPKIRNSVRPAIRSSGERPAVPTALDSYLSVTQRYATQFAQRRRESGPARAGLDYCVRYADFSVPEPVLLGHATLKCSLETIRGEEQP